MQESNVAGLFRMNSSNYSDQDNSYSNASNFKSRFERREKHYESVTKPYVKKRPMAYSKQRYSGLQGIKLPDLSKLLPFAMYGAIGLVGYKLYHKFFGNDGSDIIDNKVDNGNKAVAALIVNTNQAKADSVKNTATSLLNKGLAVSSIHQTSANVLHGLLDSVWIDDDKIVKSILQQQYQTFRLVSVAYGIRELPTYTALHISAFLTKEYNFRGTLKDHLSFCLNDVSIAKIHGYLSVI